MPLKMSLIALTILSSTQLEVDNEFKPPIVMAKSYHEGVRIAQYWYSEKLDGIRAYWTGNELITRNGNRIFAPKWFTKGLPDHPLDGELWAGRGLFHLVQQTVMDKTPVDRAWRKITFMAFDSPQINGDYLKRYQYLIDLVSTSSLEHFDYVKHYPISSKADLAERLEQISVLNGEGIMLRRISSLYIPGRGVDLLKFKRFEDDEAVVIGYKPGEGRLQGKMGSLLVKLKNGIEFYIGSGFSDDVRRIPPKLGTTITFRFNGHTQNGKPKFARFIRERLER
ncbi:DNA ligase [Vibrio sagamiensis]|uniref:ATP-dependent DNA ligase n=1 Tax=Vibrio sagamiensis NBRC 104589 TaxID=1219064 RepID=A0A511QDQ4_9VIBR|nr:DNA ligase [Vibrio sagamiensis]PNQ54253.1 DNA ligase [Vibrio agarivorans]GEM75419.1 ATP-dependent DNA ligase [Vibrio sagamiensis NBRC 104589]